MTIAKALYEAEKTRDVVANLGSRNGLSINQTRILVDNTIEALEQIIFWYDRNQRRLIKALLRKERNNK